MATRLITKQVQEPYFSYIKSGQKIYEGRLYKDDEYSVGDAIQFCCDNDSCMVRIVEILRFASFVDAMRVVGVKSVLPDKFGCSEEEAVIVYRRFYEESAEMERGVVLLRILLI
jgi:ASC-1-like (ASCH) protein